MVRIIEKRERELREAVLEYAEFVSENGVKAGEALIKKFSKKFEEFGNYARAFRILVGKDEFFEKERGYGLQD